MSSAKNKFISNQEASPVVETGMFGNDPDAILAIARINARDVLTGDDPLALAYARFRANVYIDQIGVLDPSSRRSDGGEHDDDDMRSLHFVGLENNRNGTASIIGSMRLIQKTDEYPADLPIEDSFADELNGATIGSGSFEVSRWIARHDTKRYQMLSLAAVTNTGLAHAVKHGWGPCLAVAAPQVARSISRVTGGAITEIASPRLLEKYGDINIGIMVDLAKFAAHVGAAALDNLYIEEDYIPNVFWRRSNEV